MTKENNGRSALSQKQVFLVGIVVLCVLVGASIYRESGMEATSRKQTQKTKRPPPKIKTNPDGYRMCLLSTEELIRDQSPIKFPNEDAPLPVRYQCAGPHYDQFSAKLQTLVKTRGAPWWGQRSQPIPSKPAQANGHHPARYILFLGNLHLRQVLTALLCQYSDQVIRLDVLEAGGHSVTSFAARILLQDNLHLYAVINPSFLYTDHWQDYLETHVLQMPLEVLDLMVTSKLDPWSNKKHAQPFLEFLADHEHNHKETAVVNQDPPSFQDLLGVYEGPVVYVGMFAESALPHLRWVEQTIQALQEGRELPADEKSGVTFEIDWDFAQVDAKGMGDKAEELFAYQPPPPKFDATGKHGPHRRRLEEAREIRTNLIALDGRHYVSELGECSTQTTKMVSDCIEHTKYHDYPRCFGAQGGHPDLVAYDVLEAMHTLLEKQQD